MCKLLDNLKGKTCSNYTKGHNKEVKATLAYVKQIVGSCCITQEPQPCALCQEGRDICILMADSRCCMAEAKRILQSNYSLIKNKLIKS